MMISPPAFSIFSFAALLKAEAEIFIFISNDPFPRILTGLSEERIRPDSFRETESITEPSSALIDHHCPLLDHY